MLRILRTDNSHPDFIHLVKLLDEDLAVRDGKDHSFYSAFNKIDLIRHAVVVYTDDQPAGCGAMKEIEPGIMEIKRMFVSPELRGKGIAKMMLAELEQWARELSCQKCILETGRKQPEAISLYIKCGYIGIPNYGQYSGVDNSLCFEKKLH